LPNQEVEHRLAGYIAQLSERVDEGVVEGFTHAGDPPCPQIERLVCLTVKVRREAERQLVGRGHIDVYLIHISHFR